MNAPGWPASPEENLKRLEDAGIPLDRGVPRCGNCSGTVHPHELIWSIAAKESIPWQSSDISRSLVLKTNKKSSVWR